MIMDRHRSAIGGQTHRYGFSDAAGSAGDEGDFPAEINVYRSWFHERPPVVGHTLRFPTANGQNNRGS